MIKKTLISSISHFSFLFPPVFLEYILHRDVWLKEDKVMRPHKTKVDDWLLSHQHHPGPTLC